MGKTYAIRPDLRRMAWLPMALFAFLATWALFDMYGESSPSLRLILTGVSAVFGLTSAGMLLYFRRNTVVLSEKKLTLTSWLKPPVQLLLSEVRGIERKSVFGSPVYVIHYGESGRYLVSANFADWKELGERLIAATSEMPIGSKSPPRLDAVQDEDVPATCLTRGPD